MIRVKVVNEPAVHLELSMDLAVSLLALARAVSGDPDTTYRRDSDAIEEALHRAGVKVDDYRFISGARGKPLPAPGEHHA